MQQPPKIPNGLPLEQMMHLADTPQGQAILSQLQSSNSRELDNAVRQAQAGDFQQLQKTMTEFLSTPAGQQLMKQLRGQ